MYILQGGFGGTPTADSRFAVPCPSDKNALRNPPRQHVPTVMHNFEKLITALYFRNIFKNKTSNKYEENSFFNFDHFFDSNNK